MNTPADAISREMKFIIKWVVARLKKVAPRREDKHDHSVILIFFGWDNVQYISNVHRDDAAEMMLDVLKRWNKMGQINTDLPLHTKKDIVPMEELVPALADEVMSLFADVQVKGGKPEDMLVLLEEVTTRAMRIIAKKGHHGIVLRTLYDAVAENLDKDLTQ